MSISISSSLLAAALVLALPLHAMSAPKRTAWRSAPEGTLEVTRFVIARQVVSRRPDMVGRQIPVDGRRIYGFVRVFNKGRPRHLFMVWRRDGKVVHRYRLKIGRSPGWHTWSCLRAIRANIGSWTVSLEDAGGASLADRLLTIGV
jgi:hypothetical protein